VISEVTSLEDFAALLKQGIRVRSKIIQGRTYLLKWRKQIMVLKGDSVVGGLCVSPRQGLRGSEYSVETYLAFYLNLTLNERKFLRTANLLSHALRAGTRDLETFEYDFGIR
jgi:hypothetical protein